MYQLIMLHLKILHSLSEWSIFKIHREAQKRLTLEGNIVISVGLFGHSGDQ